MRRPPSLDLRAGYPVRAMACLAASLALVVALVRLWPAGGADATSARLVEAAEAPELVLMEEVVPTRQTLALRPPPPAPLPPVVVPDDVILDEMPLDLTDNPTPTLEFGDAPVRREGVDEGTAAVAESYVGPKAVRLAEPEYPREAERRRIKAEVVIEVLVDVRGRVQGIEIVDRYLLGDENERTRVAEIGYGIEAAARAAAERWLFRPARRNGQPVEAHSTVAFSFGV